MLVNQKDNLNLSLTLIAMSGINYDTFKK